MKCPGRARLKREIKTYKAMISLIVIGAFLLNFILIDTAWTDTSGLRKVRLAEVDAGEGLKESIAKKGRTATVTVQNPHVRIIDRKDHWEVHGQMYRESFDIVREFERANGELIGAMAEVRQRMHADLRERVMGELGAGTLPELMEDYVRQYAVVTFSDIANAGKAEGADTVKTGRISRSRVRRKTLTLDDESEVFGKLRSIKRARAILDDPEKHGKDRILKAVNTIAELRRKSAKDKDRLKKIAGLFIPDDHARGAAEELIGYILDQNAFKKELAVHIIGQFIEMNEETLKQFMDLNVRLRKLPLLDNTARLCFLTEWTSRHTLRFKRRGQAGTTFEDLIDCLRAGPVVRLLNHAAGAPHLEGRTHITPNTVKYFTALSRVKQDAYIEILGESGLPICGEIVYSDRFFSLYSDVREEDVENFLKESVIMSRFYLYKQFPTVRTEYISPELRDIFSNVMAIQNKLPGFKREFLREEMGKFAHENLRARVADAVAVTYHLKTLPGCEVTIEDLFNFVNSDNFSIFRVFNYNSFHASGTPWLRSYHGMPLTLLHGGTERGLRDMLAHGEIRPHTLEGRNSKYIFFGTPYRHFSRNPVRIMLGVGRYYGNTVFEFPISVLGPEERSIINVRGNFFSHYHSKVRLDNEGLPIPDDFVQLASHPIGFDQTLRMYYATEQAKQDLEKLVAPERQNEIRGIELPALEPLDKPSRSATVVDSAV